MTVRKTLHTTALLGAALLAGAASPASRPQLALSEPLLPPVGHGSSAQPQYAPAPVPDPDLPSVFKGSPGPQRVELTPSLFHQRQAFWGDGYTPNSTIQGEQNKRIRPTPGLNLNVPLQ